MTKSGNLCNQSKRLFFLFGSVTLNETGLFLLVVMKMARPLKFKSVKELQSKIDEYFESCYETVVIKNKKGNPVFNEDGTAGEEEEAGIL
jgi:hypothetical protein